MAVPSPKPGRSVLVNSLSSWAIPAKAEIKQSRKIPERIVIFTSFPKLGHCLHYSAIQPGCKKFLETLEYGFILPVVLMHHVWLRADGQCFPGMVTS
jgi:hypothetical protein